MSNLKDKEHTETKNNKWKLKKEKNKLNENSLLYKVFVSYQQELDARNDRRERIVKLSRDITIHSKRVIFTLLRRGNELNDIFIEAEEKVQAILEFIRKIDVELKNVDKHQFTRAFSPGFQEFIEAITLLHFRKNNTLVSYEEVRELYFSNSDILSPHDYMLGVADLTGELMRMAINSIGEGDLELIDDICAWLRCMYSKFSVFIGCHREMNRKIDVMKNSLRKVENVCYTLKVRGSELPQHMLKDLAVSADMEG